MYSRRRDTRIPYNYSGNAFAPREAPVRATPSKSLPPKPHIEVDPSYSQSIYDAACEQETCESCPFEKKVEDKHEEREQRVEECDQKSNEKPIPLLSPIGALGTEEILLIALALIIFQSGNEPELALILLALLFIG